MTPRKNGLEKSANAGGFLKQGSLLAGGAGYAQETGDFTKLVYHQGILSAASADEGIEDDDNDDVIVDDDEEEEDERKFLYFFMPCGRLKSTLASPSSYNGTTQYREHPRPYLWLRY